MTKTFKVWCDSGANIHSCRTERVTLESLGFTPSEWDELSEDEKEEIMKNIALDRLD